jgi:hypothetical protein
MTGGMRLLETLLYSCLPTSLQQVWELLYLRFLRKSSNFEVLERASYLDFLIVFLIYPPGVGNFFVMDFRNFADATC